MKQFGSSVSYENLRSIDGVFEEVARGHVDYGLVPVRNGRERRRAMDWKGRCGH